VSVEKIPSEPLGSEITPEVNPQTSFPVLKTRQIRRVFAVATLVCTLSGCTALYPAEVSAVPPERDFSKLSCDELASESARLKSTYDEMRGTMKSNTRNRYAHLNGEAYAVNDSIRINECKLPAVQIPGRLKHHAYRDSPE
jgi:hypothetical protein